MSEAKTLEQQGHHEKPTGDIVDRRLSQQDGNSSIRYSGATPTNHAHAMLDHKGNLEVDPSPDWKPVELVANGS